MEINFWTEEFRFLYPNQLRVHSLCFQSRQLQINSDSIDRPFFIAESGFEQQVSFK